MLKISEKSTKVTKAALIKKIVSALFYIPVAHVDHGLHFTRIIQLFFITLYFYNERQNNNNAFVSQIVDNMFCVQ